MQAQIGKLEKDLKENQEEKTRVIDEFNKNMALLQAQNSELSLAKDLS